VDFQGLCCSVLQCVAVCCSVLKCGAVCCSVLQCAADWCSVLQRVGGVEVRCSVLHCVEVCCSELQCVAGDTGWISRAPSFSCQFRFLLFLRKRKCRDARPRMEKRNVWRGLSRMNESCHI